jgi:hypothetical protein
MIQCRDGVPEPYTEDEIRIMSHYTSMYSSTSLIGRLFATIDALREENALLKIYADACWEDLG